MLAQALAKDVFRKKLHDDIVRLRLGSNRIAKDWTVDGESGPNEMRYGVHVPTAGFMKSSPNGPGTPGRFFGSEKPGCQATHSLVSS